jgi:hypothetical protein
MGRQVRIRRQDGRSCRHARFDYVVKDFRPGQKNVLSVDLSRRIQRHNQDLADGSAIDIP